MKIFASILVPTLSLVLGFCLLLPSGGLLAQGETTRKAETPPPTGEEILRLVRMSQALQNLKNLQGRLRNNETGQQVPFELTMADGVIRFIFKDPPKEIINLDLNQNGTKLTRVTSSGKVEMPVSLYGETVRGTHLNYEDLSMRFLYWPNAQIVGNEVITFQTCWVVHVINPDKRGPYRQVRIWVDQKSGAMMQMRAFDAQGKQLKEFKVRKGQKYNDAYILKQMRVQSFDPATNKAIGITYLEIDDPG